jgi:hypothetical protein
MTLLPCDIVLLPCPFCGEEANIWNAGYGYKVSCTNEDCCVTLPHSWDRSFTSQDGAVQAWNRRIA